MKTYIAWNKDIFNLEKSSSGGIFYELARKTIDNNGAVVGVVMNGLVAEYEFTTNLLGVKKMRGSKYIRATWHDVIQQMTKFKSEILFVGLPCQLREVKNLFKDRKNITYVELICHGVIKYPLFLKHIDRVCGKQDVRSIKFRHKKNGWRNSTVLHVNFKNSTVYHKKDGLIKEYVNLKNVEERCKTCTLNGYGDIVLGDYWECPPSLENKKGTSKVVTVTAKGQNFLVVWIILNAKDTLRIRLLSWVA